MLYHTNNQITRQSRENIRLCFAGLTTDQQNTLVKDSITHTCCAFIELAAIWNHPIERVLGLIDVDYIDASFASSQRAKVIVAPHQGSWELLNYWLAQHGGFFAVYKPSRKTALNQYILEKRGRNGARLVPTNTAGMRSLIKALRSGKSTCMVLPDQRPPKNSARVDSKFFNQPAKTSLLIKNLANRVDCDIYIAIINRELVSGRYQLRLEAMERTELLSEDNRSARYLNERIERLVTDNISQYQWAYRRFDEQAYKLLD